MSDYKFEGEGKEIKYIRGIPNHPVCLGMMEAEKGENVKTEKECKMSFVYDAVQRLIDEEVNSVLESICDDLDVYIEWHNEMYERGIKPVENEIKASCYKIVKKRIKTKIRRK